MLSKYNHKTVFPLMLNTHLLSFIFEMCFFHGPAMYRMFLKGISTQGLQVTYLIFFCFTKSLDFLFLWPRNNKQKPAQGVPGLALIALHPWETSTTEKLGELVTLAGGLGRKWLQEVKVMKRNSWDPIANLIYFRKCILQGIALIYRFNRMMI